MFHDPFSRDPLPRFSEKFIVEKEENIWGQFKLIDQSPVCNTEECPQTVAGSVTETYSINAEVSIGMEPIVATLGAEYIREVSSEFSHAATLKKNQRLLLYSRIMYRHVTGHIEKTLLDLNTKGPPLKEEKSFVVRIPLDDPNYPSPDWQYSVEDLKDAGKTKYVIKAVHPDNSMQYLSRQISGEVVDLWRSKGVNQHWLLEKFEGDKDVIRIKAATPTAQGHRQYLSYGYLAELDIYNVDLWHGDGKRQLWRLEKDHKNKNICRIKDVFPDDSKRAYLSFGKSPLKGDSGINVDLWDGKGKRQLWYIDEV